jgi:predicted AlkP superfamily phosphohydrolase/phosphomutase
MRVEAAIMGKVLTLGIDGGSWNVILPLADRGLMPNMSELMKKGNWGALQSTAPPITCPAWLSLSTGRNPGWIGSFGFTNMEPASYTLRYYLYRRDPELPEIWDILGERGLSSGVLNLPVARDPRPINGYMVPGFLADDRDFKTHPGSLRGFLDRSSEGYEIEVRGFSIMEPEKTVRGCREIMAKRHRAMRALLDEHPTDFFLGVFHLPDRVCHASLNRTGLPIDPEKDALSAAVAEFYGELDGYIGDLAERSLGDDDLLLLVSDHGFAPCPRGVNINTWLAGEGYLHLKPRRGRPAFGINQRRIASALNRVGLLGPAIRHTPRFLGRFVPEGTEKGGHLSVVDLIQSGGLAWEDTAAVALPNHGIYLNTADRPLGTVARGSERDSLIKELRRGLLSIVDEVSGIHPVTAVHEREELYEGPRLDQAPDLVVETVDGWANHAFIDGAGSAIIDVRRATHRREGIYLMAGRGVRPGRGPAARLEDIAPTVLRFLGIEDLPPMDGQPLL